MRRVLPTIVILVLALVGCAGEPEPTSDQAPTASGSEAATPLQRTAVAVTATELELYRQDLAQIFAKRDAVALRRGAGDAVTASVDGHASVTLVKVNADGALDTACVDNAQAATQFLTSADGVEVK
jgi:hypothetical protein